MEWALFIVGGTSAIGGALAVILEHDPIRSVRWLGVAFVGVAMLFVVLGADVVALAQVPLYGGAIVSLVWLFGTRLYPGDGTPKIKYFSVSKLLGTVSVSAIWLLLLRASASVGATLGPDATVDGTVKTVGGLLIRDYGFALAAVAVLGLATGLSSVALGVRARQRWHG